MFATLPFGCSYGGVGMVDPLLNHRIELSADVARQLGQKVIYPDLYWPQIGFVIEYDSVSDHDTMAAASHDAGKRMAYARMGLQCATITVDQFRDRDALVDLLEKTSFKLTDEIPRRLSKKQRKKREALHWRLLHGTRLERQYVAKPSSGQSESNGNSE